LKNLPNIELLPASFSTWLIHVIIAKSTNGDRNLSVKGRSPNFIKFCYLSKGLSYDLRSEFLRKTAIAVK
jgi:hypothetical protein